MCIFSQPAVVHGTAICVCKLDRNRQFTVYQNTAIPSTSKKTAMILPYPTGDCEMIDSTKAAGFFDFMRGAFVEERSRGIGGGDNDYLPVKAVGNYYCSYAITSDDLDNIDPNYMSLDTITRDFVRKTYPTGFSFLVCTIIKAGKNYPIAMIHNRMKNGSFFIPTMHDHGDHEDLPNWDHEIYVIGGHTSHGYNTIRLYDPYDYTIGKIRSYFPNAALDFPSRLDNSNAYVIHINGKRKNEDIIIITSV